MHPTRLLTLATLFLFIVVLGSKGINAHCDGMDGPVVKAAMNALDTGDVNLVLVWVAKGAEAEIRRAFDATRAIRRLSPEAMKLSDTYFFETLVRVHRTGEGAAYTGLKPAGRDLGPAIPAADRALESGSVDDLVKLVTAAVETGLREHFATARARKTYDPRNVAAGREYVEAYVQYVHYVERVYEAATQPAQGHFEERHPVK